MTIRGGHALITAVATRHNAPPGRTQFSGHHQSCADHPLSVKRMNIHAEPSELVDPERHENIGGDRQSAKRGRADIVNEQQQVRDDGECADQTAEWAHHLSSAAQRRKP
jgi:hypothetical protein